MESTTLLCPDWVISTGSNVHYAKDRAWFGDYQPINSFVKSIFGGHPIEVKGIGTVFLPVKTSLKTKGSRSHGTLRLNNVLHVPRGISNVVGTPVLHDYNLKLPAATNSVGRFINPQNGKTVALTVNGTGDFSNLAVVKLSGCPVGPRTAPPRAFTGAVVIVSVEWSSSEQGKWLKRLTSKSSISSANGEAMYLTPEENEWLRTHYGGEFKFLLSHGLSIYEAEERQEGRAIIRAFIAVDKNNASSSSADASKRK